MKRWAIIGALCIAGATGTAYLATQRAVASDHDDGEQDLKGRALNLTDLYVFREDTEKVGGDKNYMVFIMNSNPRALPQQQYFFSTQARYEFHVGRAGTSKSNPLALNDDVLLRFEFGAPNASGNQAITFTTVVDGAPTQAVVDTNGNPIMTTAHHGPTNTDNATSYNVTLNGSAFKVFAGLRQDPFFFNVTGFFAMRAAAAAATTQAQYQAAALKYVSATPTDFTSNYNVNTIAVRVPIGYLQKSADTTFDVWETISVPQ